jgi:hypothetical protein
MKRYDRRSLTNLYFPPLCQLELQDKHADAEKNASFPPFNSPASADAKVEFVVTYPSTVTCSSGSAHLAPTSLARRAGLTSHRRTRAEGGVLCVHWLGGGGGHGGDDGGAAERARRVEAQPRADAVGVEPVAAPRELPRRVAVLQLHDAHRALHGLPTGAGARVDVHGQGRRHVDLWRLLARGVAAPMAADRPRRGHGQRVVVFGAGRLALLLPGEEPPEEEEDEDDHEHVDAHDDAREHRAVRRPLLARVLQRRRRRRGRRTTAAAPERGHGFSADRMDFHSTHSKEQLPMVCINRTT